jgi:nitroimidazol reductase NimA-like FMN-containing flavoprotein (pyridoxamine 5'-phosphate oxidase superfamily)
MTSQATTTILHLSVAECEALLAEATLGRLGVVVDGRPEIFPVCHVYVDGSVAFPTNEGTKLHAAEAWPSVVFEVDGIEPDALTGWSVVVKGRVERVDDPDEVKRLALERTALWRTGPSSRWVRIVTSEITGRQFESIRL